jgi:ESS family glutamate:Na+ symporter
VFCLVQNFVGMGIAEGFGENPLLGVMAGSVTLVGGPATGMAFAPIFEQAGLRGAGALALTSATAGIVCGGLVGGPVGTRLIQRYSLAPRSGSQSELEAELDTSAETLVVEVDREDSSLIRNLVVLALAMGLGSIVSGYIQSLGITLPAYIGAMLVASLLRNLDDGTGWLRIDQRTMEFVGNLALNIFLVVALMNLKLWELAHLALPLTVILLAQVLIVLVFAMTLSFRLMGRDYDSAVMASGFVGFVLGTTANAVANMRALVARFGPAPRAFLVVPLVGAFFIDFTNALIITFFVNWLK